MTGGFVTWGKTGLYIRPRPANLPPKSRAVRGIEGAPEP